MTSEPPWQPPPAVPESLLGGDAVPGGDALRDGDVRDCPGDPLESAVIRRLAGNWQRRAAVKREEPDLDALFDPSRPDFPERVLPFHDHPSYRALAPAVRSTLLSWAWVAYNDRTVQAEQRVVNSAFGQALEGAYPGVRGEALRRSLAQAMVDEQYHTLMHLDASALTIRQRGLSGSALDLPAPCTVRTHARLCATADHPWQPPLITLAFATVAELSINAYLNLLADDHLVQPVNSTIVRLHSRDEYCHASITAVLAETAYQHMSADRRRYFLEMLGRGLEAFAAQDYLAWQRIMALSGVRDGSRLLADAQADRSRHRLFQDHSGLRALVDRLGAAGRVDFEWQAAGDRP